jgi:phenylpropionate dioxygenase-like ring-hydroxylating dioxygenase large terminal subunit
MSSATSSHRIDRKKVCGPRGLGTDKVRVDQYVSNEFYEREKSAIWKRSWLLIGRANDIPNPGDFFTFDLSVINTSVLVVRGRDQKIRAFHNACRHRGARVRYQDKGSCKALTCTFHGWVYDLNGKLINVPFKDQFPDCGFDNLRLEAITLDLWGGFIFINLDPKPVCGLQEYLEPMPHALRDYFEKEDWRWYFGYKGVFRANWKILVDAQAEGHHGPFLHRRSVPGSFTPEHFPAIAYPNSAGVPFKLPVYVPAYDSPGAIMQTPLMRIAVKYGNASLYTTKGVPRGAQKYPGAINTDRRDYWIFDDYCLFPNTVFLILDNQVLIQRCWPLGPHKTAWEMDHYFCESLNTFGELLSRWNGILGEWNTMTEDMVTVEGVHQSIRSGAIDGMYLSDLEVGVRSYERRIMAQVTAGEGNEPGPSE